MIFMNEMYYLVEKNYIHETNLNSNESILEQMPLNEL